MSVTSYLILKLKPRTKFYHLCSSFFLMFSYTFMRQANEIHRSQLLFGTMVGSPGYMAAEI